VAAKCYWQIQESGKTGRFKKGEKGVWFWCVNCRAKVEEAVETNLKEM